MVLGPLLFLLYVRSFFSILENKVIDYANDSIVIAVVPSAAIGVTVAESLIRDQGKVSEWSGLWGMKLNASKTRSDCDSLQVTHNASPVTPLTSGRIVLKESDDLVILGVTFNSKMTLKSIFARFPEQLLKGLVS